MASKTRLLTDLQVSRRYGIPANTLRIARSKGYGPDYVKLGRAVRYRSADVDTWLQRHVVQPEQAA